MLTEKSLQESLVELEAGRKSMAVAYVLWLLVGWIGLHRYYMERPLSGIMMLLLAAAAFFSFLFAPVLSLLLSGALCLWYLLDGFLIPRWVRKYNIQAIKRIFRPRETWLEASF